MIFEDQIGIKLCITGCIGALALILTGVISEKNALKVLVDGEDISTMPIEYAPQFTKEYNPEICEELGITVPDDYVAIGAEDDAAEETTEEAADDTAADEADADSADDTTTEEAE